MDKERSHKNGTKDNEIEDFTQSLTREKCPRRIICEEKEGGKLACIEDYADASIKRIKNRIFKKAQKY